MAALSGRKAKAARNDRSILESARAVFLADPTAPVSAVTDHAGVGISALYRRYKSKDELLRRLAMDDLRRYIGECESALADASCPGESFAAFMARCVDSGAASLTRRLAGTFTATEEFDRAHHHADRLTQQIVDGAQNAGVLRTDINVTDLSLVIEQLQSLSIADPDRTAQLRRRYLHLMLQSLRPPPTADPLPGPAPEREELRLTAP